MKMIGSQITAQFSTDWKSKPEDAGRGAIRSTRKASLPFSRMKSFRPAFTSQPVGHRAAGRGHELPRASAWPRRSSGRRCRAP